MAPEASTPGAGANEYLDTETEKEDGGWAEWEKEKAEWEKEVVILRKAKAEWEKASKMERLYEEHLREEHLQTKKEKEKRWLRRSNVQTRFVSMTRPTLLTMTKVQSDVQRCSPKHVQSLLISMTRPRLLLTMTLTNA